MSTLTERAKQSIRNSLELKRKLGFSGITHKEYPTLQIHFLEELCKLWPYTIERHKAIESGHLELLPDIDKEEAPIRLRASQILQVIVSYRVLLRHKADNSPKMQRMELGRCKEDPFYHINYWMWIHEPRLPEIGLPAKIPFILYDAQRQVLDDLETCYHNRQDCVVCKSREAGISWGFCALDVNHWTFIRGYSAIHASEKEEKVDLLGSVKTLFGKSRYLIYSQPTWLRPSSFDVKNGPNDNFRRLVNPDNDAEIVGEAGVNIGRSGRASVVRIDESQDITTAKLLDASLESVTNCRVDVGTPKGMNHFGEMVHSGKKIVSRIWWYDDPRKNPKWREGKKNMDCPWRRNLEATKGRTVIAQEYDQDFQASVEDAFIPAEYVAAAVDFDLPAEGDTAAGYDVSSGGDNKSIYILRKGSVTRRIKEMFYDTPTESTLQALEYGKEDKVQILTYDQDGVGESVWGEVKTSDNPIPFMIKGVHGNSNASERMLEDEGITARAKFCNKRAENWWNLMIRFKNTYEHRHNPPIKFHSVDEMISIPNDPILVSQLSQPKRVWRGAKTGVESKKDMRRRGVKSPDHADALVNAFADSDDEARVFDNFDYTGNAEHYCDFFIDLERSAGDQYVSIRLEKDMTINVIGCMWYGNPRAQKLQVYTEMSFPNGEAKEVIDAVNEIMCPDTKPIREWVANEEMFPDDDVSGAAPWFRFKKHKIGLRRNYTNDDAGTIMIINEMFRDNMLQIHTDCESLMFQILNRIKQGGKLSGNQGLALCLCQVVTRLRKKKRLRPPSKTAANYNGGSRFASKAQESTKIRDLLLSRTTDTSTEEFQGYGRG